MRHRKRQKTDDVATALRLKEIREFAGLSQKGFGEKLDLHQTSVGSIERGIRYPSLAMLRTIKRTFHISTDYILTGKDEDGEEVNPLDPPPATVPLNKSVAEQGINILKILLNHSIINDTITGKLKAEIKYAEMIASGENDLKALEASIALFSQQPGLRETLDYARQNSEKILASCFNE